MKNGETIVIVGTGTVGYELIRRLVLLTGSGHHYFAPIANIFFHKETPRKENIARIAKLQKLTSRGIIPHLCVNKENISAFKDIGMDVYCSSEEALSEASVIVDATPAGAKNKERYDKLAPNAVCVFEGSEYKKKRRLGPIYIGGINEVPIPAMVQKGTRSFVVGSCNAHAIARNIKIIASAFPEIPLDQFSVDVTINRRSDDPNKTKTATSFSFTGIDTEYAEEGSYHAYNVIKAFESVGETITLRSKVRKLVDPFMHCLDWRVTIPGDHEGARIAEAAQQDQFSATTEEMQSNIVYWDSKEVENFDAPAWFIADRCYMHSILCVPTIRTTHRKKETIIEYGSFTPQDSNVIVSNIAMIAMALNPSGFCAETFYEFIKPLMTPKEI